MTWLYTLSIGIKDGIVGWYFDFLKKTEVMFLTPKKVPKKNQGRLSTSQRETMKEPRKELILETKPKKQHRQSLLESGYTVKYSPLPLGVSSGKGQTQLKKTCRTKGPVTLAVGSWAQP